MSNITSTRKSFRFSVPALNRVAQRLLGALQDSITGPPVVARLSATFLADFEAQIGRVLQHGLDQGHAIGTAVVHTRSRKGAAAELLRLAAIARDCAGLAFPTQASLLSSEFQVGVHTPRDLARVLERARRLLAACRNRAEALAPWGWSLASSDALSDAIDALAGADQHRETASDVKESLTAQRAASANELYRHCRAVQHAARLVYTNSGPVTDSNLTEGRTRFMLAEFPTRLNAFVDSTGADILPSPTAPAAAAVPGLSTPVPLPAG